MTIVNTLMVTSDVEYSHRLRNYIAKHNSNIKLTILNDVAQLNSIALATYSVVLIGDEFEGYKISLPSGTNCGYLSAKDIGGTINDHNRYCKYRSGETIVNIILDLYSEVSANSNVLQTNANIYVFASAVGGMGASLVSAAYAVMLANRGLRVLHFTFDRYCTPSLFFDGQAQGDFSDFIFSVISSERRNTNLSIKAASLLSTDSSGVKYMNACKNAADMDDILTGDRLKRAFDAIQASGEYDAVVVDLSILDTSAWNIVKDKMKNLYLVSHNDIISQNKLKRVLENLKTNDTRNNTDLLSACRVIINRDVKRQVATGTVDFGVPIIGHIPEYKDGNIRAIINAICLLEMWNNY